MCNYNYISRLIKCRVEQNFCYEEKILISAAEKKGPLFPPDMPSKRLHPLSQFITIHLNLRNNERKQEASLCYIQVLLLS